MTVFCFVSRLRRSFKKRAHRACTHKTNSLAAGIFSLETLESRKYLAVSPMAFSSGIEQIGFGGKIVEALNDQYILRMQQTSPSTNSFDYKHAVPVVPKNWSSASIGYGFYKISAPETSLAQVQAWGTKAGAKYVEPSLVSHFSRVPNDPMYGNYSPDQTTNLPGLYGMKQIGMETAWNTSIGSSSVVVAVIDSGIDRTHPDLQSNLWVNRGEIPGNGRDDDGNGYVDDVNGWNAAFKNGDVQDVDGHGTHVSGTIAAAGNNALGVVGVNWQAKIMAVDVNSELASGAYINIPDAIIYVIKQKQLGTNVVAINASYGSLSYTQSEKEQFELAGRVGITVVASAGNDGTNNTLSPQYPASYDLSNIISVAATDQTDALAEFSNFGRASVDLGAPGVGILSTLPRTVLASDFSPTDTNNDSVPLGYGYSDGTSMAAPHVTGAVALLKAIKPSATVAEIRDAILGSVQKRGALTTFVATGGRLSVAGAVSRLIASPTLSIAGASVSEGNIGTRAMTFSITANHGTSSGITVRYATSGGTATAGIDYRAVSGVARILPWQTSTTFTVLVTGDRTVEPDEYFTVTLSNAIGGTIEKGTAFGGIFNDDGTTPSSFPSTIPSFFSLSSASGLSSAFVAEAVEVSSKSVAPISTNQLKSPQSASFFNVAAFASDQPTVVSGKPAKKFAF